LIDVLGRCHRLHSADVDESYRLLRFLADQESQSCQTALPRYAGVLAAVSGIGPKKAARIRETVSG